MIIRYSNIKRFALCLTLIICASIVKSQTVRGILTRESGKLFISYDKGKSRAIVNERVVTVRLKDGMVLDNSLKILRSNRLGYIDLSVPEGVDVTEFVETLEKSGSYEMVKYADVGETCMAPNDTYVTNQWYLSTINMPSTWNIMTGSPDIRVAVLDLEVDWNHQDVGMGVDGYKNIDNTLGYNYKENTSLAVSPEEHGTLVAGIIGAKTNNMTGVAGIAGGNGGQGVTIIPYGVGSSLGSPYIDMSVVDDAILDAVDKGAKVINMSLGSISSYYPDIDAAILYAHTHGVTLVAASGNDYLNSLRYPASHSKVIAVGATDTNNQRASFSNYGTGLDLVAPGIDIFSTTINNSYVSDSGTSFSAPQVSGVAALMLSLNPTLAPDSIRSILRYTCTKISGYSYTSGWNNEVGYGLLNAYAAVKEVLINNLSISGPSVVCDSTQYSVDNLPNGMSVTWSVNNNRFKVTPYGNQCKVTYDSIPRYDHATLSATIMKDTLTVTTLTKRIVMHGTDMYVEGIQSDIYDENGDMPAEAATFTIPATLGSRGGMNRLSTSSRDSIEMSRIPVVFENTRLVTIPDNPTYGVTEIYGGAVITLMGDRFDGMTISFSGDEAPEYLSTDGTTMLEFRMPEVSSITNVQGYYYVVLHATSEGCCHDFDLYFKVVPVEGESIGDPEISLYFTDSSVRVDFDAMEWEELPGGLIQNIPWYLSIYRMAGYGNPSMTLMHSSTNYTESKTVSISNWPSGIYLVRIDSNGSTYTKKFLKQ